MKIHSVNIDLQNKSIIALLEHIVVIQYIEFNHTIHRSGGKSESLYNDVYLDAVPFSPLVFWGNLFGSVLFAVVMGFVGVLYEVPLQPFVFLFYMLELAMLIVMAFLRRRKQMGYTMAYSFTGFSGFVTGIVIGGYPPYMSVVGTAAFETLGIFAVLSLVAILTGKIFLDMGRFLYSMLIALIVVDILSWLLFNTTGSQLALSSISGALFCGFILYDIQRAYRKKHADSVPLLVVSVYLDILNLFLSILNLNAFSRK